MDRCKWFGHKWQIVYIRKGLNWSFVACYCERCQFGYKELLEFVKKHKPIINTYSEKYFSADK